jgi:hypothetical protein
MSRGMCSIVDRLAFAARSMRFEVVMEGLMPIRIKHRDKTWGSNASLEAMFRVLYGSI